tara:strand:+ start:291 stop:485 length:195 start_codon:yes stop_codon:yes gene_type:complete
MNKIKIEELMKVRFDCIANRIGRLSKRESESLLLEHLEWLEGGWETVKILFLKTLLKMVLNQLL